MSQKQTPLKLNTFQGISIVANTMLGGRTFNIAASADH